MSLIVEKCRQDIEQCDVDVDKCEWSLQTTISRVSEFVSSVSSVTKLLLLLQSSPFPLPASSLHPLRPTCIFFVCTIQFFSAGISSIIHTSPDPCTLLSTPVINSILQNRSHIIYHLNTLLLKWRAIYCIYYIPCSFASLFLSEFHPICVFVLTGNLLLMGYLAKWWRCC